MTGYLVGNYDAALVATSYVVAAIASFVALDMAARISATTNPARARRWLVGGALAMGGGIWSMHFIGMLAFRLPITLGYDLGITLASLLVAVLSSAYALWRVSGPVLPPTRLLLGAVVLGLGVAGMHYLGMEALRMRPAIDYHPGWFAASIVIAIAAAGTALWIAFSLRRDSLRNARLRVLAALVMGLAIVGMHYTGMAAARFPVGSICSAAVTGGVVSQSWLAALIGVAAFAMLGITVMGSRQERVQAQTHGLQDSLEKANQELAFMAMHDPLTRLPNRSVLADRIDQLAQRRRHRGTFAVMVLDLDGFKAVNDAYGHDFGDRVLQRMAELLQRSIGATDTLGRTGGDEFIVLSDVADAADAARLAETLLRTVAQPLVQDGRALTATTSIGVAMFGTDGDGARELLAHADSAMRASKSSGRNEYRFFERSMNRDAHEQLALMQDLRIAIERRQLCLHYQPKWNCEGDRVVGAEALVRWQHPQRGLLGPGHFIPLAERTGLILEIGRFVIDEACRQFMAWRADGLAVPSVSVNLSAAQFASKGLFGKITTSLQRHGMPASALMLEVTESTAMQDAKASLEILERLVALGVKVSIDDFGTGYSSLLYLKQLPASELKIDRAFVHDMVAGGKDEAIIAAIIALGRTLDLSVTAEGVETAQQQEILRMLGCTCLQGYLLGRPQPPEAARTWFEAAPLLVEC